MNAEFEMNMKDPWLISALMAALSGAPVPLAKRVQPAEGGGRYVAEALPIVEGNEQYVLFTFCTASGGNRPGVERHLYPPFAVAHVSYPAKKVVWRAIERNGAEATATLLDADKQPYLGNIVRTGITPSEWTDARVRYNELIGLVLERKWLVTLHPPTSQERQTAKELADCIRIVYDKPLMPYYRLKGRQLFAWIERASK